MTNPLVSIIIPTFNRAHLIFLTLDSVLKQSYQNWECIIVDDGSTDNTEKKVNKYLKIDNRFIYVKRPSNYKSGGNGARNYGFSISKGEFINWFDSDDLMYDDFLKNKIEKFNDTINVVCCGFIKVNKEQNFTSKPYNTKLEKNPIEEFANKNIILNTQSFMIKRELISNSTFDENLSRAQDLDFIFNVISTSKTSIFYTNTITFEYLVHSNSITGSFKKAKFNKNIISELIVRNKILNYYINETNYNFKNVFKAYIKVIKMALDGKSYTIYFKEIVNIPKINILLKSKLLMIGIIHFFTNKGSSLLIKDLKKAVNGL